MTQSNVSPESARIWLSGARYARYLSASGNDDLKAIQLYEWNARLASACLEAIHYVEIATRNALDTALQAHFGEATSGIPWFLSRADVAKNSMAQIDVVRDRIRKEGKRETRDQIIAGLSFGFWRNLVGRHYQDLWNDCVRNAFPNSSGDRKDVAAAFSRIHPFRNRVAHHEPIFNKQIAQELQVMLDLVSWLEPPANAWLEGVQSVRTILAERPAPRHDTVVVAAREAWPLYESIGAYICQPGRSFRDVDYVAFYHDRQIQPDIARILSQRDNVVWTPHAAAQLSRSADPADQWLGRVIEKSRAAGWTAGRHQVFELSRQGDPDHVRLKGPIPNHATGKNSAFTRGQRYVVTDSLRRAKSTNDLMTA